jgi:hypothetical protein
LQLVLIFILFYSYFLSKITIKIRKKKALAHKNKAQPMGGRKGKIRIKTKQKQGKIRIVQKKWALRYKNRREKNNKNGPCFVLNFILK